MPRNAIVVHMIITYSTFLRLELIFVCVEGKTEDIYMFVVFLL